MGFTIICPDFMLQFEHRGNGLLTVPNKDEVSVRRFHGFLALGFVLTSHDEYVCEIAMETNFRLMVSITLQMKSMN